VCSGQSQLRPVDHLDVEREGDAPELLRALGGRRRAEERGPAIARHIAGFTET